MDVHIGSLIRARAKFLRIGPTELGIKIDSSKQNVYGIFKRDSIDSQLLYRICMALDHDFFSYLSEEVRLKVTGTRTPFQETEQGDAPNQKTEDLLRECMYLRRLNGLLEEKLNQFEAPNKGD